MMTKISKIEIQIQEFKRKLPSVELLRERRQPSIDFKAFALLLNYNS
jgi:hypothetical protein